MDRDIELILAKRKADIEKIIKVFDEDPDMKVLKGRWGPYISFGKKNIKIPKDKDPLTLTFADCVKLDKETVDTGKSRGRFGNKKAAAFNNTDAKKAASKKTTAKKSPAKKAAAKKAPTKVVTTKAPSQKVAVKKAPAKKKTAAKKK